MRLVSVSTSPGLRSLLLTSRTSALMRSPFCADAAGADSARIMRRAMRMVVVVISRFSRPHRAQAAQEIAPENLADALLGPTARAHGLDEARQRARILESPGGQDGAVVVGADGGGVFAGDVDDVSQVL